MSPNSAQTRIFSGKQERSQQIGRVKPSRSGGYITLQDERQDVEELQLAVLHICLDVFAHEGPARLIAHISTAVSRRRRTSAGSRVITAADAVYAGTSQQAAGAGGGEGWGGGCLT